MFCNIFSNQTSNICVLCTHPPSVPVHCLLQSILMHTSIADFFLRTMFHCPAILLALAMSVGISEAYVLPPPGLGSSDVCHSAQSHSRSLHSLLGLCDGVSSSASVSFNFSAWFHIANFFNLRPVHHSNCGDTEAMYPGWPHGCILLQEFHPPGSTNAILCGLVQTISLIRS